MEKPIICGRCEKTVCGTCYMVHIKGVSDHRHLWCLLGYSPMLKRSLIASGVVGTILILLNQGDFIFAGQFYKGLIWKVPLTYVVPFCVATWGAVTNAKTNYGPGM